MSEPRRIWTPAKREGNALIYTPSQDLPDTTATNVKHVGGTLWNYNYADWDGAYEGLVEKTYSVERGGGPDSVNVGVTLESYVPGSYPGALQGGDLVAYLDPDPLTIGQKEGYTVWQTYIDFPTCEWPWPPQNGYWTSGTLTIVPTLNNIVTGWTLRVYDWWEMFNFIYEWGMEDWISLWMDPRYFVGSGTVGTASITSSTPVDTVLEIPLAPVAGGPGTEIAMGYRPSFCLVASRSVNANYPIGNEYIEIDPIDITLDFKYYEGEMQDFTHAELASFVGRNNATVGGEPRYECVEFFHEWDIPAEAANATEASIWLKPSTGYPDSDWSIEAYACTYTEPVDTTDWVDPTTLSAETPLATLNAGGVDIWTEPPTEMTSDGLLAAVQAAAGGTLQVVFVSSKAVEGAITDDYMEYLSFHNTYSEGDTTTLSPTLEYTIASDDVPVSVKRAAGPPTRVGNTVIRRR